MKRLIATVLSAFFFAGLPVYAWSIGAICETDSYKATYAASSPPVARATSATDMFLINGSASKTIRVLKIYADYDPKAGAAYNYFYVNKQSTAGSGGTSSAPAVVPLDSGNAAGTAVVLDFTANRTLGTLVGSVSIVSTPTYSTYGTSPGRICLFDADKFGQAVVLRGTAQGLAVSNNGVTLAGSSPLIGFTIVWTEE